jgi:hypothetical protein
MYFITISQYNNMRHPTIQTDTIKTAQAGCRVEYHTPQAVVARGLAQEEGMVVVVGEDERLRRLARMGRLRWASVNLVLVITNKLSASIE